MTAIFGTAVVCGALSLTGTAYAEHLAQRGYDLLLIDEHRTRLHRLAASITNRTRRAVEVVVIDRHSPVDLAATVAQINQDASIAIVVNVANARGHALLSEAQAQAMINGVWFERELTCAAIRKFLAKRSGVRTYQTTVHIVVAGHVAELPSLI